MAEWESRFRAEAGSDFQPGGFEEIESPGRLAGRCSGRQAEMLQDLGDNRRFFDRGDDFEMSATRQGQDSRSNSNTRLRKLSLAFAFGRQSRANRLSPYQVRGKLCRVTCLSI